MNGTPGYNYRKKRDKEMQNHPIIEQAKAIADSKIPDNLEQAEEFLLNHLKDHPRDTQGWLALMMIEWTPPLEDFERIIKWAKNVLTYDPVNAYAFLVMAEAHWFFGGITEEIYLQLDNAKHDDPNIMAMILVAKAKYLEYKDDRQDEYEKILKESIKYGPEQARNYRMLGKLYIKQGKVKEGEKLITKSTENQEMAELLHPDTGEYDLTSLTEFLDEWYTGL
jgi:tetratricopeptide (TPR) repeat protein